MVQNSVNEVPRIVWNAATSIGDDHHRFEIGFVKLRAQFVSYPETSE